MPATKQDTPLKWIEIDDFTPGIVQNTNLAQGLYVSDSYPAPGKVLGQAQIAQGCIALPNGGLAPLPGLASTTPWGAATPVAPQHALATGVGARNLMTGLFLSGPLFYYGANPFPQTKGDELIIGQSQITSGGNQELWIDSLQEQVSGVTVTNVVHQPSNTSQLPMCTLTGGITRANNSPSLLGIACWALGYWFPAGAAAINFPGVWQTCLYPDPTAPTGFGTYALINSTGGPGEVFCHQNRVVTLQAFPTNYTSASVFQGDNEKFLYTDPPNGLVLGGAEIFVQEDPTGYGAWGSISASELFLVKSRLGGVLIAGDLNAPTVTVLPGVMPTYGLMSRAAATPAGLVYAVNNRGLWAWNGGNVSQKISNALLDDFFVNYQLINTPIERGPTVDICRWGDWIVTTNNWVYDTNTGGWWQLNFGNQGVGHQWFVPSSDGMTLYACPGVPSTTVGLECYSRSSPSQSYVWESYPIRLQSDTKNKGLLMREVVVRAQGNGSVTVTLQGPGGVNTAATTSPNATITVGSISQPVVYRVAVGLQVAHDVTISLAVNGGVIVYSVAVGYDEGSELVGAT